ncbi:MAG: S8 family serine peptidase [Verrucomicrobiales bacterium]|jgi:hypothetical protein|nr:S8 family serine peptidase [Verrucomicrobiales bacterium]
MFHQLKKFTALMVLALLMMSPTVSGQSLTARNLIIVGDYDPGQGDFLWASEANNLIGTAALYGAGYWGADASIANVEGGLAWFGHEVFTSRDAVPVMVMPGVIMTVSVPTFVNNTFWISDDDYDGHATAVTAMMAGIGLADNGALTVLGTGIAPLATIQSGAIATEWSLDDDGNRTGPFTISRESFLLAYKEYFVTHPVDVINSSWGYTNPTGRADEYAGVADGLARQNPTVALVVSAGNAGPEVAPGGIAAGFNTISVGALDYNAGHAYDHPAAFTSSAPQDFYNPVTDEIISGVRARVDIAAPGTGMVLATYVPEEENAAGLYYINAAGTSFAAPMVSGGIALLKDLARGELSGAPRDAALDTRVIKAVLMAGATRTAGWDNGQHVEGALTVTTQALDYSVGAGLVNLERSAYILLAPADGQRDGLDLVNGGWELTELAANATDSYTFQLTGVAVELTVSLNWFSQTVFIADADADTAGYQDLWFSNLNLGLYRIVGEDWLMVAQSTSIYGNTEFLRLELGSDTYGIRVTNAGTIFDTIDSGLPGQTEAYALAWSTMSVPEPAVWVMLLPAVALLALTLRHRRQGKRVAPWP